MSFLVKRNQVYHLHVKVPRELVGTLGSGDISISLGTRNRRKAGKLAELANVRYQLAFRELKRRGIKPMGVDIKKLVRDYVKDDLDTWELQHALAGRIGDSDSVDAELAALDTDLNHTREALSTRNHVRFMSPHLTPGMLGELATVTDPRERDMLCYQMLRARIRLVEANIEQLTGHFSGHDGNTILQDLDLVESASPLAPPSPAPTPTASLLPTLPEPAGGPTLSELVDEFQKLKVGSGKWRETTVMNHKPKLEALLQALGRDTPVDRITVDQCREFAKILEGLPPSFYLKGYKDLSEISSSELEGKNEQLLDNTTRREYLNLARSLFQFALENEYLEKNPLIPGLIPPKKGNTRSLRSAYTRSTSRSYSIPRPSIGGPGRPPASWHHLPAIGCPSWLCGLVVDSRSCPT